MGRMTGKGLLCLEYVSRGTAYEITTYEGDHSLWSQIMGLEERANIKI